MVLTAAMGFSGSTRSLHSKGCGWMSPAASPGAASSSGWISTAATRGSAGTCGQDLHWLTLDGLFGTRDMGEPRQRRLGSENFEGPDGDCQSVHTWTHSICGCATARALQHDRITAFA